MSTVKKPLPFIASRGEIYEMYKGQIPLATMKKNIDTIIEDKTILPNLPNRPVKGSHIFPHEFYMEIIRCCGIPAGYYITDDD